MEEQLKELKNRFQNLRNVSKVKDKDLKGLVTTNSMMLQQKDNMTNFSLVLDSKIIKEHEEIAELAEELNELKFTTETKVEHKEFKLDHIEKKHNTLEDSIKKQELEVTIVAILMLGGKTGKAN